MRVIVDLETEAKLRFLDREDPRAWFLTYLEKGMIHKLSKPPFICNYDVVHCDI